MSSLSSCLKFIIEVILVSCAVMVVWPEEEFCEQVSQILTLYSAWALQTLDLFSLPMTNGNQKKAS